MSRKWVLRSIIRIFRGRVFQRTSGEREIWHGSSDGGSGPNNRTGGAPLGKGKHAISSSQCSNSRTLPASQCPNSPTPEAQRSMQRDATPGGRSRARPWPRSCDCRSRARRWPLEPRPAPTPAPARPFPRLPQLLERLCWAAAACRRPKGKKQPKRAACRQRLGRVDPARLHLQRLGARQGAKDKGRRVDPIEV